MRVVAVTSVKGGVGKTAIAVNLAFAAATQGGRRTLIWDLDAQGATTFLLRLAPRRAADARRAMSGETELGDLIQTSEWPRLDVLPADASLRRLDRDFAGDDRVKRLKKLLRGLAGDYDRVILDCPPGLTELGERVIKAADVIVAPLLPSPLSTRALEQLQAHIDREHGGKPPIVAVWSMVDRRKSLHKATVEAAPDRVCVPYAAAIEAMAVRQAPIGATEPGGPAAMAFAALWAEVERVLI